MAPVATRIQLTVDDNRGNPLEVRIKTTTYMRGLFETYCDHALVQPSQVTFLFGGVQIHPHDTAASIGMRDGDQIDAFRVS